jgi:hypothetical protein
MRAYFVFFDELTALGLCYAISHGGAEIGVPPQKP